MIAQIDIPDLIKIGVLGVAIVVSWVRMEMKVRRLEEKASEATHRHKEDVKMLRDSHEKCKAEQKKCHEKSAEKREEIMNDLDEKFEDLKSELGAIREHNVAVRTKLDILLKVNAKGLIDKQEV